MVEYSSYIYNELLRYIATNVINTKPISKNKRLLGIEDTSTSSLLSPVLFTPSRIESAQSDAPPMLEGLNKKRCKTTDQETYRMWEDLRLSVSTESYSAKCILFGLVNKKYIYIPYLSSRIQYKIVQFLGEINNRFLTPEIKTEFILHYCKMKQVYWGCKKLARIWKIRKTPVRIQTDLYMNELDQNHSATFRLVQEKGIYLFTFNNLVRIILEAITHQVGMFIEPLPIKNPYTNSVLSKTDLFNIYFGMRLRNIRIHELFEKLFRCEFNIFEFRRMHETELRDIAIDQHAKTASYPDLLQDVDDMLRTHKMTNKIKICPGFPLAKLVDTMRPLLKLYLLERYSFSSMTRRYSKSKLTFELNYFAGCNPMYGRRTAVGYQIPPSDNPFLKNTEYVRIEPSYVMHTNPYHKGYCFSKYMETHIYKEDIFDKYVELGDTIDAYIHNVELHRFHSIHNQEDNEEVVSNFLEQLGQLSTVTATVQTTEPEPAINDDHNREEEDEDEDEDDNTVIENSQNDSDYEMEEDGSIS